MSRKRVYIYGYVIKDGEKHFMPLMVREGYLDVIRRMVQRSHNTKKVWLSYGDTNTNTIFT